VRPLWISACLRKVGDGTADQPFESVDDLWRRADVQVASPVQLAEADAMNESLELARREALWALKALRDAALELFAAAAQREARTSEEVREPAVSLQPMMSGGEVVEDYRHVSLTLRQHPASFLRTDLASRRIVTCADAMNARDGKWLTTAGLVLVRQNRIRQGRHVLHDQGRDRRRQPRHLAVAL
jgi:error-prone DNA polymerase